MTSTRKGKTDKRYSNEKHSRCATQKGGVYEEKISTNTECF